MMGRFDRYRDEYRASLKSMDTEEHIDLAFYRPLGFAWACAARELGITPNAITIASIFLGIGAGVAFYFNNLAINIVGMILLVWANSFDSADGQLARMTRQYSRIGRILDGVSGDLWFAAIYVAICLREVHTSLFFEEYHWVIWVLAVGAGLCHATQAALADYYRQFHLYFLKGAEGSELDTGSELKQKLGELSWSRDFFKKLTLTFYTNYTLGQERRTASMQELRGELALRYPDGRIPRQFREVFRDMSLPLMKYTNILSFNWRCITLFVALFAGIPWLYFVAELTVFNLIMMWMNYRHERICTELTDQLRAGLYPAEPPL